VEERGGRGGRVDGVSVPLLPSSSEPGSCPPLRPWPSHPLGAALLACRCSQLPPRQQQQQGGGSGSSWEASPIVFLRAVSGGAPEHGNVPLPPRRLLPGNTKALRSPELHSSVRPPLESPPPTPPHSLPPPLPPPPLSESPPPPKPADLPRPTPFPGKRPFVNSSGPVSAADAAPGSAFGFPLLLVSGVQGGHSGRQAPPRVRSEVSACVPMGPQALWIWSGGLRPERCPEDL